MNKNKTVLESSGHVEECSMNIVCIQHSLLNDRLRRVKYSEIQEISSPNPTKKQRYNYTLNLYLNYYLRIVQYNNTTTYVYGIH